MDIIEINRSDVFTLEEAQELLPVIFRITKQYCQKVDQFIARSEALGIKNEELSSEFENQVSLLVQEWQGKVQKLGAHPKGLWIADFDSGDGYFCWKYPERKIEFWHKYNDGYSKRTLVSELRKPVSLQDRIKKKLFSVSPITPITPVIL